MNSLIDDIGNALKNSLCSSPCHTLRVGDGTTSPAPTQTALAHQTYSQSLSQSGRKYTATAIIGTTESDLTVKEMGAFDSNGQMLSRVIVDAVKPAASAMILEWALTMTAD